MRLRKIGLALGLACVLSAGACDLEGLTIRVRPLDDVSVELDDDCGLFELLFGSDDDCEIEIDDD